MRIGLITEGIPDQAVIENIISAYRKENVDIIPLRPDLMKDGSWVKKYDGYN